MFTCTINTMSDECHMTSGKTNSNNGICLYMQGGRQKGHHLLMAKVFDCFEKYGNTVPFLSCRWRPWLFLIRCGSSILCFSFRTSLLRTPSGYIWTKWCLPHVRSTPPEECETTAVFFLFLVRSLFCVCFIFSIFYHSTAQPTKSPLHAIYRIQWKIIWSMLSILIRQCVRLHCVTPKTLKCICVICEFSAESRWRLFVTHRPLIPQR